MALFLLKNRTLNSIPAGRAERFKLLRKLGYKTVKAETTQQVTASTLSKLLELRRKWETRPSSNKKGQILLSDTWAQLPRF